MVKNYSNLERVEINTIRPKGWLFDLLNLQAEGITGNLEVAGYPFNTVGWDNYNEKVPEEGKKPDWWPYEQTAYWVDGMQRCGMLLNSRKLLDKANKSFEHALSTKDNDGYIGPKMFKNVNDGWMRWAHVVFFRALMAKYDETQDSGIVDSISNFYLNQEYDYSAFRDVMNVEIMLWAYLQNNDQRLLLKACDTYKKYNEKAVDDNCIKAINSRKRAYAHGVTHNEFSKLGAILYICTGDESFLQTSVRAYEKIDRYQMLPSGLHSSSEFVNGNGVLESHETCDVSDYTWSLSYLLMATGNGAYGDKIEKCVFNAGIGSITEDFRALQYFSCPNQVVLDNTSNHNAFNCGSKWMSYRPNPGTSCCPGNVNRFLPNYCSHMWMHKNDAVYAVMYGPCEFSYKGIKICENTKYPFNDEINFQINTCTNFSFYVRIPSWCKKPVLTLNGNPVEIKIIKGFTFVGSVKDGDIVTLVLPSSVNVINSGSGVYVEKGPLVYSLGMYGRREIDTADKNSSNEFPAYSMYADKPWNYALYTSKDMTFSYNETAGNPWDIRSCPCSVEAYGRQVRDWKLSKRKRIKVVTNLYKNICHYEEGIFLFTPGLPTKKKMEKMGDAEVIRLYPLGVSKVRMTILPKCQ